MSERQPGSIQLLTIQGIPVFVHWTFPLGGLPLYLYAGFDPYQTVLYCLAYVIVIVVHELGHMTAARHFELKVTALNFSGMRGDCRFHRPKSVKSAFLVYSAGLLANLGLLILSALYVLLFGVPSSVTEKCFVNTFIFYNALLIVTNLIPMKLTGGWVTDGKILWDLLQHVWKGRANPLLPAIPQSVVFPPETRLLTISNLRPLEFTTGIEILNDNTTPMDFVVAVLERHLGLGRDEAIKVMFSIHTRGGILMPLSDMAEAQEVADAISGEALQQGRNLVCRAVDATE